jgi:hypothetical protein
MRNLRYLPWTTGMTGLLVTLAACGSSGVSSDSEWGSEPVEFFEALSAAYAADDFYGVLDFYAVSAEIENPRGDIRGGGPVADLLRFNSGDLTQELQALHLGENETLSLVQWTERGGLGAIVSGIEKNLIAQETVFTLAASLGRSQRASPDVISIYDGLYGAYAEAWSMGSTDYLARLYAPDAAVRDPLAGIEVEGHDALFDLADGRVVVTAADLSGEDLPDGALPVYLGPSEFGQDPRRAVGVFRVTDAEGCERRVAVRWQLEDGLIVEEDRYEEVASFRLCAAGELPAGFWTEMVLPGPSDEAVTGVVRTAAGQEVAIHNGTPRLEALVLEGLARYSAAGITEPLLDSVTFEPSRGCGGVSGRVADDDGARDLFLCIYERDLCAGNTTCQVPLLSVRVAVLHELGHAWTLDQVTDDTRAALLDLSGRETWRGENVPWAQRGVEYAAEVLAWGLAEEAIPMVRLGAPPCEELTAAFELLTARTPLRDPADCGGD